MKRLLPIIFALAVMITLLSFGAITASAAESGYYTYEVTEGEATITDCDSSISGSITVPSTLGGYPVTSIDEYAFEYCTSLKSITIPSSITSIGKSAFHGCTGLTSITIPDSVTSIDKLAFSGCTSLKSITIPDSVTSIGKWAFEGCTSLTKITLPFVGEELNGTDNTYFAYIFYGGVPASLKEVVITKATSIDEYAFRSCTGLTSITIPDSVTSIGGSAFSGCTGLKNVTLSNNITTLESWTFSDCSSLTSIVIPDSVTSFENDVFSGCNNLTSIKVSGTNSNYVSVDGILFDKTKSKLIRFPMGKTVGDYVIPSSVTSIGDYAFEDCTSLTSITISNSVTSIGKYAFYSCTGLTSITVPDSVTSIGYGAFSGCSGLQKMTIPFVGKSSSGKGNVAHIFGVEPDDDGYFGVTPKSLKEVVITKATSIDSEAFESCSSITSITIPSSVTSIGNRAFWRCDNLTSINVSAENSNYASVDGVLFNKTKSVLIRYPSGKTDSTYTIPNSVTSIGGYAFEDCTSLTSITIPSSVTSIGGSAFNYCTNLVAINVSKSNSKYLSVGGVLFDKNKTTLIKYPSCKSGSSYVVPNSVTTICDDAFYGCKRLTDITLPNSITELGGYAFYGCSGLKSINSLGRIRAIYDFTFYGCKSLTSITIPDSINYIGARVFRICNSIKDVYYTGSQEQWSSVSLGWGNGNLTSATWHYNSCNLGQTHTYKLTATSKATTDANGKLADKCTVCGDVKSTKTIYKIDSVKFKKSSSTYTGSTKKPSVIVKDSKGNVISSSNYTITYPSGMKKVGTYKVKITFKGNYSGTKTLTYKIKAVDVSELSVKFKKSTSVYDGTVKKPSIVVKDANGKTVSSKYYTITYPSGMKKVGTYKVKITFKGNYSGTKILAYKILPKAASVNKLTAGNDKLTVKLNKVLTQSTGYQIQYSTSKDFKSYKTKTVKSYKTSKSTLTGLKDKKTYYVRVRTYKVVGDTKFYSAWSDYKRMKTK